jgi:hypothetical protein
MPHGLAVDIGRMISRGQHQEDDIATTDIASTGRGYGTINESRETLVNTSSQAHKIVIP